ncbi:MAG: hypothetical protein P8Y27_20900 [Chromatiaceae bacterium]
MTIFAFRPWRKGAKTVIDPIVERAGETANSLRVPEGLDRDTSAAIGGMQRFYIRMVDHE